MPRLATNDTKDRYTRQVVRVRQSVIDGEIVSYYKIYLYALDGGRIGSCSMFSYEDEIEYPD